MSLSPRPERQITTTSSGFNSPRSPMRQQMRHRMRRLQRGDDALLLAENLEGGQRGGVIGGDVGRASRRAQIAVLRPDAGIIQPGGDAVRLDHLAVRVLQQIAQRAVQHARTPADERGRVLCRWRRPRPPASTPISRTASSPAKGWNMPMALLPPPTQATTTSGRRPSASSICARVSRPITDWKSRTIMRVGMRPDRRADEVVRRRDVRHPVADRLVDRVLERAAAAVTGRTSAPSSFMRKTLSAWRRMSSSPM